MAGTNKWAAKVQENGETDRGRLEGPQRHTSSTSEESTLKRKN